MHAGHFYQKRELVKKNASIILATLLLALATGRPASAEVAVYGSAEAWGLDEPGFHGILIVDGRFEPREDQELRLTLNTDTAIVRYAFFDDEVEVGIYGKGQYVLAGLLQDYYLGAEPVPEYGFDASYVEAGLDAKLGSGAHWVHARIAGRKWFFSRNETADFYALPPDFYEFEQEIGYTYWDLAADAAFAGMHRIVFERLVGIAFGARIVAGYRNDDSPWGLGLRNNPAHFTPRFHQWLRAGFSYFDGARLQVHQEAGAAHRGDDVTRTRIGGLNPYVVRIAGVPWAGFLSQNYASARMSHHVRLWGDVEWVLIADGAMVWDVPRVGLDEFEPIVGLGTGLDWRAGPWQFDLALGYSPDTGWQRVEAPLVSGYLGVGYAR